MFAGLAPAADRPNVLLIGIDAKRLVASREEISLRHFFLHNIESIFIGLAVNDSSFDAATGQRRCPRANIVIASATIIDLEMFSLP